ncbi:hypothetical protein E2P81_ATG03440 [Venturia nashicola]|nr:hypothetical protein E2P81_ATG03440 [Venturia nashicola]
MAAIVPQKSASEECLRRVPQNRNSKKNNRHRERENRCGFDPGGKLLHLPQFYQVLALPCPPAFSSSPRHGVLHLLVAAGLLSVSASGSPDALPDLWPLCQKPQWQETEEVFWD